MSTHPYIPLFVDDYEAATAHLSIEEDGVYNRLLRLCWRTPGCSLPNDHAWIARKIRVSAADFERVGEPVLAEFFTLIRGRLTQRRLKREYDDISRKKSARKMAGKKGGDAKARKTHDNSPSNASGLPADARAFPDPYPDPEPKEIGAGQVLPFEGRPQEPLSGQAAPKRGARLKAGWRPSAEEIGYAIERGMDAQGILRVEEDFRDYWTAASGQNAIKLDWSAAWRRWVRTTLERNPVSGGPKSPQRQAFV